MNLTELLGDKYLQEGKKELQNIFADTIDLLCSYKTNFGDKIYFQACDTTYAEDAVHNNHENTQFQMLLLYQITESE